MDSKNKKEKEKEKEKETAVGKAKKILTNKQKRLEELDFFGALVFCILLVAFFVLYLLTASLAAFIVFSLIIFSF